MTTWPAIDHSLLSPSGRMSKRARKEAIRREGERLFAGASLQPVYQEPTIEQRRESLLHSARNLRDLAARGMKPRAYVKAAEKLEKEAAALDTESAS